MLDFEKLDNLYTKAFAMRKKKHWLSLSWDFLIGIKTKHHGMWYGLPVINTDDDAIGFAIYDKAYGLPVVRYMLDEGLMDNSSDYECESFLNQQNVYYFTFVNKSELRHWKIHHDTSAHQAIQGRPSPVCVGRQYLFFKSFPG